MPLGSGCNGQQLAHFADEETGAWRGKGMQLKTHAGAPGVALAPVAGLPSPHHHQEGWGGPPGAEDGVAALSAPFTPR